MLVVVAAVFFQFDSPFKGWACLCVVCSMCVCHSLAFPSPRTNLFLTKNQWKVRRWFLLGVSHSQGSQMMSGRLVGDHNTNSLQSNGPKPCSQRGTKTLFQCFIKIVGLHFSCGQCLMFPQGLPSPYNAPLSVSDKVANGTLASFNTVSTRAQKAHHSGTLFFNLFLVSFPSASYHCY